MSGDIRKIRVGDHTVGMIGLEDVFREVQALGLSDEGLCRRALLEHAGRRNYIAPVAAGEYMDALWREYRRSLGENIPEPAPTGIVIEVVGPGCPSCDALERRVVKVLSEMGLAADFRHVREAKEASKRGIVRTPALVVGGVVKAEGRVPSEIEIRSLLSGSDSRN